MYEELEIKKNKNKLFKSLKKKRLRNESLTKDNIIRIVFFSRI